jgi:predicted metal-binding membrane protein
LLPALTQSHYRVAQSGLVWLLLALSALSLLVWGLAPLRVLDARNGDGGVGSGLLPPLLFLMDWMLMCAATMLPTSLPMLAAMQRLTAGHARSARLTLLCAAGFLAVWAGMGVLALALEQGLRGYAEHSAWAFGHQRSLAAGLLALSGAYLLSPWAQTCASSCRSPMSLIAPRWTGAADTQAQAWRIGLAYGVSCVGCCWPLMLLMCLLGVSNPFWMLALGLPMALQKSRRWGARTTRGLGMVLVLAALLVLWSVGSGSSLFEALRYLDAWLTNLCRSPAA